MKYKFLLFVSGGLILLVFIWNSKKYVIQIFIIVIMGGKDKKVLEKLEEVGV